MYSVLRVTDRAGFDKWVRLTESLYTDDSFVPPLRGRLNSLFTKTSPLMRDGEIEFFAVVDDAGNVLARSTAHTSPKIDEKFGQKTQLFGYTEFINDYDAFETLFQHLTDWARDKGRETVFGPVSLLPNQTGGVLTSGFLEKGFVDSPYNHSYYSAFYERFGFDRCFSSQTWTCPNLQDDATPADTLFAFDDSRMEREGLVLHEGSRRRLGEQLPILHRMLNSSFKQLGYYTDISLEELEYQVQGLNYILEERLLLYLTRDGVPVSFMLCVPDISEFIVKIGGDLNLLNQLRLFFSRGKYRDEAILVVKGSVPAAQGKGYMNLLSRELLRNLRDLGYKTLRTTFVEHENAPSASQFVKMGGRPLHGLTFYRLSL